MPLYKYEVLVDLPDNDAARVIINQIHGAVCGGEEQVHEDGSTEHACARWWTAQVHGFTPVLFEEDMPPEEPAEGAVEVEWDDDAKAVAEADHKMAFEDGLV